MTVDPLLASVCALAGSRVREAGLACQSRLGQAIALATDSDRFRGRCCPSERGVTRAHTLAIEELRDRLDHGLAVKQLVVIVIRAWY